MSEGNERVILCERGIRTYETYTRNTLDLSAIPVLKGLTHLPVVVDPSHATGKRDLVKPMALAGAAAGTDGLMIEVHTDPRNAGCDGAQSLTPEQFAVAVDYGTTGREKDMFEESIAIGILLEILAKQLQGEEPEDICEYDYAGDAPQHILAFAQFILLLLHSFCHFSLDESSSSMDMASSMDKT